MKINNNIRLTTIILSFSIVISPYLYAQEGVKTLQSRLSPATNPELTETEKSAHNNKALPLKKRLATFLSLINSKAYANIIDKDQERSKLRQEWKNLLGVDAFYPHYKAKEVQDWVKKKAGVRLFKVKGHPEFKKDEIKYTFKIKF